MVWISQQLLLRLSSVCSGSHGLWAIDVLPAERGPGKLQPGGWAGSCSAAAYCVLWPLVSWAALCQVASGPEPLRLFLVVGLASRDSVTVGTVVPRCPAPHLHLPEPHASQGH